MWRFRLALLQIPNKLKLGRPNKIDFFLFFPYSNQQNSPRKSLAEESYTLKRKMQKELEQKRKEYLLEAENVVRIREEAFNQELLKLQTELEHQKRIQVN